MLIEIKLIPFMPFGFSLNLITSAYLVSTNYITTESNFQRDSGITIWVKVLHQNPNIEYLLPMSLNIIMIINSFLCLTFQKLSADWVLPWSTARCCLRTPSPSCCNKTHHSNRSLSPICLCSQPGKPLPHFSPAAKSALHCLVVGPSLPLGQSFFCASKL